MLPRVLLNGLWIAPIITVFACVGFLRKVHTRAALGAVVGAIGGVIVGVVNFLWSTWAQWRFIHASVGGTEVAELQRLQGSVTLPLALVALAFGFIFSVSLWLMMRALPDLPAQADSVGPADSQEVSPSPV